MTALRRSRLDARLWAPLLVFVVCASVFGGLLHLYRSRQLDAVRIRTTLTAEQAAIRVEEFLAVRLELVRHLGALWREGRIDSPATFALYATAIEDRFPGFMAVNWVDPQGFIRWVVPEEPNLSAKDKNLWEHPDRNAARTFAEAERAGELRVTPPLGLLQGGKGIAAYFPLTEGGRRVGYLNAVFRLDPAIALCLKRGVEDHYEVAIYDGNELVYAGTGAARPAADPFRAAAALRVGDRSWLLTLTPKTSVLDPALSRVGAMAGTAALVFSLAMAWLTRRLLQRGVKLAISEQRYRTLAETTQAMIFLVTPDHRILYANPAAIERLGYSWQRLSRMSSLDLIAPEHRENLARIESLYSAAQPEPTRLEMKMITASGEERWFEMTGAQVRGEQGVVRLSTSFEITERKRAEQALRESEEKYREIFESAHIGMFRLRLGGEVEVIDANSHMALMYGYDDVAEFIAQHKMRQAWFDPADRDRMYELFRQNHGVLRGFEARFRRRDGAIIWVRFSANLRLDRGYMEGVGYETTEEKRALGALRRREAILRSLAAAAGRLLPAPSWRAVIREILADIGRVTEVSRVYLFENRPAAGGRLTASQRFEWVAEGVKPQIDSPQLRPLPYDEGGMAVVRIPLAAGEVFQAVTRDLEAGDLRRLLEDHEIRAVLLTPVFAGGQWWGFIGFDDCQSERRWSPAEADVLKAAAGILGSAIDRERADAALHDAERQMFRAEKMASLGQIVAGVAHEINNPNNFIYFNLPILKRYFAAVRPLLDRCAAETPDLRILKMPYQTFLEDTDRLIDNMQHGSERITSIVGELRAYIRSHEVEEKRPERLEPIVNRVMTLVGKQASKSVKRLDVAVAADLPLVLVNAGRIEQVLINLLINAAQAADKEDSWVRLSASSADGAVQIVVEDNGSGIPEELLGQIFDPFFTTKGREAGTGLGLSISQRIVEEHGGRISVTSQVGAGARFVVELPAAPDQPGGT